MEEQLKEYMTHVKYFVDRAVTQLISFLDEPNNKYLTEKFKEFSKEGILTYLHYDGIPCPCTCNPFDWKAPRDECGSCEFSDSTDGCMSEASRYFGQLLDSLQYIGDHYYSAMGYNKPYEYKEGFDEGWEMAMKMVMKILWLARVEGLTTYETCNEKDLKSSVKECNETIRAQLQNKIRTTNNLRAIRDLVDQMLRRSGV